MAKRLAPDDRERFRCDGSCFGRPVMSSERGSVPGSHSDAQRDHLP
jgi:hypothetical protein